MPTMLSGSNSAGADPTPFSGKRAHQTSTATSDGASFQFPDPPLSFGPDEVLFSMVFLDPTQTPKAVWLGWESSATNIAVWTNDPSLTPGTNVVRPLPPVGQWIRLEVV